MKVTVLGGGTSTERDVSKRSARAVADAGREAGFEIIELDPAVTPDFFEKIEGIVLPILHGTGGEDGAIQSELEARGIPYLGSISTVSAICFDKVKTRQSLTAAGLPVARGDRVTKDTYNGHKLAKRPHVLKVARGGSSIGTYIVRDVKNIDADKIAAVFELDQQAVIEELANGVEITIPILDGEALPVFEVVPPEGQEFDYENKYNGKTKELCPPVSINAKICGKAQRLAEKVHAVLGARHLSRVDIIVRPDDSFVILELNTMPGMTEQSFYPQAAQKADLPMPKLVEQFIDLVKRDYGLK